MPTTVSDGGDRTKTQVQFTLITADTGIGCFHKMQSCFGVVVFHAQPRGRGGGVTPPSRGRACNPSEGTIRIAQV